MGGGRGAGPLVFKTGGGAEYPRPPGFFTPIFHRLVVFYKECDYSFYRFIRKVLQKQIVNSNHSY